MGIDKILKASSEKEAKAALAYFLQSYTSPAFDA